MSTRQSHSALLLLSLLLVERECPASEPLAPATIVRIALPAEDSEHRPFALPTEPENTLEIDFPWPLEDWAGRGFTPDPEKFAGDFVIQATRGKPRLFVTPVATQAHRVLLVVLAGPGGQSRSVALELVPAPAGLAWRKVAFEWAAPEGRGASPVTLSHSPACSPFREPTPESEIGLLRTLRLMVNTTPDGAKQIAAANPALQLGVLTAVPRSFGDYSLTGRFALRDASTDTLGLCVSVANQGNRRLMFQPDGWVVRAGDRVYPVRTVDFPQTLEPGSTALAFLVLARGPDGDPTRLLPDNAFEFSAVLAATANPRTVSHMELEGFEIR